MLHMPIKNRPQKYTVNPTKIICLGLNYHDHIQESVSQKATGGSQAIPTEPVLFNKTPNVLIGHEESIIFPKIAETYHFPVPRVDYEAELAMIISRNCKDISPAESMNYILGYTCMNDVSQRNIQISDKGGWFRGKSFDTFGPIGPCLVLKEDLPDPQNLQINCRLNGKIVQQANTSMMIFKIPDIVSFISKNFTLNTGDIIMTGTPSGVGPLTSGDTVEVEIEGIGILRNCVR
ncbi:MAG: fumarylacetoacetate hydrolase family protein [Candidatus Marinimicrobia bacterium]|nr:fumarylacetoacetate hydrolase family protein [Candidatus Neomarinimicrobiota bacterium]